MMKDLFQTIDLKEWLREYYEERHREQPWYSYRYMAGKIGCDPGYFVKIIQGQTPMPLRLVKPLCDLLELDERQRAYFSALVDFSRAKTERESRDTFQALLAIRDLHLHTVQNSQFEYFTNWYYCAIRSLCDFYDFHNDFEALGKRLSPPIASEVAKSAIDLLFRVGVLKKDDSGRWIPSEQFITTGNDWNKIAVRDFQKMMLTQADQSLEIHKREDRDFSTLTVSMKHSDLLELKERIAAFRQETLKWISECQGEDTVYQINIQVFPLTTPGG
jgi:uncharacterized protein (TIGR02147 family)